MSGEINRVPKTLLSQLDLTGRGDAPRLLAPQLQATLDIRDLYSLGRWETRAGSTTTLVSVGEYTLAGLQVPQDEYWYVHSLCAYTGTLAAGTTYEIGVAVRKLITTTPFYQLVGDYVRGTAGTRNYTRPIAPQWFEPGDWPCVLCKEVIFGGAITASATITFTRFRA